MLNNLIGEEVFIVANEFIEESLSVTILAFNEDKRQLLLKIQPSLIVKDIIYPYAIASTRLEGDDWKTLVQDALIGCSITWIPTDKFKINNPFDLSWWRGGATAITSMGSVKNSVSIR